MDRGIWKTKDGRTIKIIGMADDHLINSIRLLRRTVRRARLDHELAGLSALNFVQGEMATLSIEQSLEQDACMTDDEWLEYHTPYDELIEEAKRRDILSFIGLEFFSYMQKHEKML